MNLSITTTQRPDGLHNIVFSGSLAHVPVPLVWEGCAGNLQASITTVLIFQFTRMADAFAATALDLGADPRHVDECGMLVIALDTRNESLQEAADRIRATVPVFLYLVGRKAWSGYARRRAKFDVLTQMAELIEARVKHTGSYCDICLHPLDEQGKCGCP